MRIKPEIRERSGMRKLHLVSGVWQYRIGRNSILMYSPAGKRYCVRTAEMIGWPQHEYEKAKHKRSVQIEPSQIQWWIERKYL